MDNLLLNKIIYKTYILMDNKFKHKIIMIINNL